MKRIITFAIMALMIGGFTIYANAQPAVKKNEQSSTQQGQSSTQQGQSSTQNSNSSNKPKMVRGGQQSNSTQSGSFNSNTVTAPAQDWTPIIDEWLCAFERSVINCESGNAELQKVEKQLSKLEEQNQRKASQRKTGTRRQQELARFNSPVATSSENKTTLLTKKQNLEKSYQTEYNKAKSLKKDIAKEINRVSVDQAQRYNLHERNNSLTARFNALPQR